MKRALVLTFAIVLASAVTAAAQTPAPAPQNPAQTTVGPNFVDANGDGVCDLFQARGGQGAGQRAGRRAGKGGFGPGGASGNCDGTGPKGRGRRGGRG